jgi:nitroreductase
MQPITDSLLLKQLHWRYATKKFDPTRKIGQGDWQTLESALVLAPSSFGLQPWKFLVVSDEKMRKEVLRPISFHQPQVSDCSHMVIFAARRSLNAADVDRHINQTAKVRNLPVESLGGMRQHMIDTINKLDPAEAAEYCATQTYIALGIFLASAALLGIDACPMEGIDRHAYDKTLGLTEKGYRALCIATAGYRSSEDKHATNPKVRFEAAEVIEHL